MHTAFLLNGAELYITTAVFTHYYIDNVSYFFYSYRLSKRGYTIILSIHQPRYDIFQLFDTLHLLSTGETVYHGPAEECLQHFNSNGLLLYLVQVCFIRSKMVETSIINESIGLDTMYFCELFTIVCILIIHYHYDN